MADFPIFEEIKNFLYTNLESILLIVVPFSTFIGWIAERHNKRLNQIEVNASGLIEDLKRELAERERQFEEHKREFNEFKVKATKDLGILKALYSRKMYDEFEEDNYSEIDNDKSDNVPRKIRKRKKDNNV